MDVLVYVLFANQNFLIKSKGIVSKYNYGGFPSALIEIQTEADDSPLKMASITHMESFIANQMTVYRSIDDERHLNRKRVHVADSIMRPWDKRRDMCIYIYNSLHTVTAVTERHCCPDLEFLSMLCSFFNCHVKFQWL